MSRLDHAKQRLDHAKQRNERAEKAVTEAHAQLQRAMAGGKTADQNIARTAYTGALKDAEVASRNLQRAEQDFARAEAGARVEEKFEVGAEEAARTNAYAMLRHGAIRGR